MPDINAGLDDMMAKKTTPVRLSADAIKWAKIASGYTGESMAEYVSRIVEERAKDDVDKLHASMRPEAKSKRPRKGPLESEP
jgi:hypothetical protein